jgi:hypothetical protein
MTTSTIGAFANAAKALTLMAVGAALTLGLAGPADAAAGGMYGDPAAAAQWWRHQTYDDCAIMSAADVVGQVTGKEPTEDAIIAVAASIPSPNHPGSIYIKPTDATHPNSGQGTASWDIPTLLEHYGVRAVASDKTRSAKTGVPGGMAGLEQLLSRGRKVIVSVNGEMIWGEPVENKDDNGNPRSDHAVVVTGIDTVNNVVHLNDSGTKDGRDEQVPLALFVKAWNTSNQRVVVTTQ